jgi:hypothetical protein
MPPKLGGIYYEIVLTTIYNYDKPYAYYKFALTAMNYKATLRLLLY